MKKIIALTLAVLMIFSLAACAKKETTKETTPAVTTPAATAPAAPDVMTYAEYDAAALDAEVIVECYVQAHQSWWDNKITVYAQDENGGYFLYEMACSEEDAAKLVPGTKLRVTGTKAEWSGEVEIVDATFEIIDGNFVAEPMDATALLGTEDLIKHQNKLAAFKGVTIEKIEYKNGEPGDDIYVTVSKDGENYDFCVERYLTDPSTDVYKAFADLTAGDIVDIEGFIYWYNGVNTHITGVTKVGRVAMEYAQYDAAALDTEVVVECYVQAHQSWWDNKITVYAQDENGGYFLYEMACSEEDAAKLVPGTKIRVSGVKAEWSGEVEIVDATFEIIEGNWIAEAMDATALLGTEDLIKHQNKLAIFKGVTIEKIEYKNGEPGDDIYVTVGKDGKSYDFCVERYLTDPETDVYKAFANLKAGDVVDIQGFIYWYNGVNTHITAVSAAQ